MICINNTYTDAYFNLAAEEYLLKNSTEDIFMLWQDEPSVIVGKYQNVLAEINLDYVKKNDIKVVRRFSGGGTVFHDLGNINITFIEQNKNVDFGKFTQRIVELLSKIGIKSESDERRAININGLKISGSAQCIHKNRAMYHATLLFSSNLDKLVTTLENDPQQVKDTTDKRIYVKSVKSPVTNLIQHLEKPIDIDSFKQYIMDFFLSEKAENRMYQFTKEDVSAINFLVKNKYATQEWNFNGNNTLKPKKVVNSAV